MMMKRMKMSKEYDDMSFDELQKAYRAAVDVRKKFNIKVRELTESIEVAGKKYKKLQEELAELENIPVPDDVYREEGILALIGQMISAQPEKEDPERKPLGRRKVKKDD
jgi:hypothetical protein